MRIVDLLRRDVILILPELSSTSKREAIHELASFLAARHVGLTTEEVERVLIDREQRGSTAVDHGLAIPHGTHHSIRDTAIAALARSRKGIQFGAPDGKPTHFFFVLIAPENMPGLHLKALAQVSRLFKNADFRTQLAKARTVGEMYDILAAADEE